VYIKEKTPDIEKTLEKNRGASEGEIISIVYKIIGKKITRNKKIRVPICKPENFGSRMCINKVLKKYVPDFIRNGVKILTKDLAENYENVRENSFLFARGVADKFHVVKLGTQALSDLRISYRQGEMTKERLRREVHKCNEASNREIASRRGEEYETKKCPPAPRMRNGETVLQILASSNRALSQFQNKWGKEMQEKVKILFQLFPSLEKMYRLISAFREIYNVKEFGGIPLKKARISLEKWFKSVGASEIIELQNR